MALIQPTENQYVRPGVGTHTFNYVGVTGSAGGFILAFVDLLGPINVDLAGGTASSGDMSATGLSYVRYVGATQANDTLKGGGPDVAYEGFVGNGGNDDIDGGAGFDLVMYDDEEDYGAATSGGWANGFRGVVVDLAAGTATDSYGSTDSLKNIEGATGTSFKDKLTGDANANRLVGMEGRDSLVGGGGKDTLEGGVAKGNVTTGNDGRDTLTGGTGKDEFRFNAVAESTASASKRDFITDFKHNADDIDVSLIDANLSKDGDQKFVLDSEGSASTAVAKGHIGWYQVDKTGAAGDRTILRFNVDDDKAIEMEIELKGLVDLTKGDFIL